MFLYYLISCMAIMGRLPFWPYVKLFFCMWLVLPMFNGAAYIYENYVRKYVKIGGVVDPNYPEGQRKVLQMMSLDSRKAVERYIERNGPDAFERVVKAVRYIILTFMMYHVNLRLVWKLRTLQSHREILTISTLHVVPCQLYCDLHSKREKKTRERIT